MQFVYQIQQQTAGIGSCIAEIFLVCCIYRYMHIDIGRYVFTHLEYGKCKVFGGMWRDRESDSGTEKKEKKFCN